MLRGYFRLKERGFIMIKRLTTKTDINGNKYKVIFDTDKKIYARENAGFFHKSDFIIVTKRDINNTINELKNNGYKEVNCI